MHSDSCPCKFRADLVLCRSKTRGYRSPKAHPNAFFEAANKMHLAMLPLMTSKGAGIMLAAPPNEFFRPGKMHSGVCLTIDSRLLYGS